MSIPGADLQRSEETQTCTPLPADYNMELKSIPSGAVVSKKKRFFGQSRSWASDNASFTPDNGNAFQKFRTDNYITLPEEKTNELDNKEQKIMQLEGECKQLKEKYTDDMKCAQKWAKHYVHEMTKIVAHMQGQQEKEKQRHEQSLKESLAQQECKINNLCMQHEEEKKMLESDSEAKIKQLTEKFKQTSMLAEMQMMEKCNDIEKDWKLKLEKAEQGFNAILNKYQDKGAFNEQCNAEECKQLEDELKLPEDKFHADYERLCEIIEFQLTPAMPNHHKSQYQRFIVESLKQSDTRLYQTLEKLRTRIDNTVESKLAAENRCKQLEDKLKLAEDTFHADYEFLCETVEFQLTPATSNCHKSQYQRFLVESLKQSDTRLYQTLETLRTRIDNTVESKLAVENRCKQLEDELQRACCVRDSLKDYYAQNLTVAQDRIDNCNRDAQMQVRRVTEKLEKAEEELRSMRN